MWPAALVPYKDIVIVIAICLALGGVYGKGWYDRGILETSKLNESSLNSTKGYIKDVTNMEKKNEADLDKKLDAIDKSKDVDDGPVAPVLRDALERLRVSK